MDYNGSQSYIDKVLSRLLNPGLALLVAGAAAGYASGFLAGLIVKDRESRLFARISLGVKAIGCAAAVVGALMTLDIL